MHPIPRARVSSVLAVLLLALAAGTALPQAQAPAGTTAFEGARVIVGDGSAPIENATIVVHRRPHRRRWARPASVTVPAGAARVSLAGKTVMPTIVDTHVHLSTRASALIADLRRRAYFGVGAAMSLGLDPPGDPFQVRASRQPAWPAISRPAAASPCPSRAAPTCPTG